MASPTVYWRVEGSLLDLTVVQPVAFFTWNAQTFVGALVAAGADLRDGGAATVSLFDESQICDARGAHRIAGREPRPAGSAGRRILPIQIEAAIEGAWGGAGAGTGARGRRRGAGEPGAGTRDEAAGAASGSEADRGQPAGVSRWRGDGKATGAGDPAAGSVCVLREQSPDGRRAPKTLARQLDITLEELRAAAISSGREPVDAGASDRAFRGATASGRVFRAPGAWRAST